MVVQFKHRTFKFLQPIQDSKISNKRDKIHCTNPFYIAKQITN